MALIARNPLGKTIYRDIAIPVKKGEKRPWEIYTVKLKTIKYDRLR
jgi:hypothetical protein